ncbi:MAG: hypothetical protein CM1200mP18_05750 [Gammaproteobacteria bacterium]|nr:MAG: hypothetical protein CM1200mP18_05750 [Gammaproteobacteria bacterium]
MIVASFLTKDLLIDWKLGERFFFEHLVDGDPASNNGGWQWAPQMGKDAQPYFRIFNPWKQSERWDPKGDYIRRWVAELRDVPASTPFSPICSTTDVRLSALLLITRANVAQRSWCIAKPGNRTWGHNKVPEHHQQLHLELEYRRVCWGKKFPYDRGHKRDRFLTDELGPLWTGFRVFPEVESGLGLPRPTMHLAKNADSVALIETKSGLDHTKTMEAFSVDAYVNSVNLIYRGMY